jgi:LuxR family maltose regulon positive regulatory protein
VARPRLVERLRIGLRESHKLTLISAPAGYGMSSLVTEWLAQAKYPVAWLSLNKAGDEALRFFMYFMAALRRADGTFGAELTAALEAGQLPPVDVLVTTLVAGMLLWDSLHILVLDDFQHIDDTTILDGLQSLLEHQPYNFHLVIVTREDPPLPLARLRVRNQLTEIRAEDLRFNAAEAGEFLCNRMGLALSREDLAILTDRTEGWVAGLKLAG